MTKRLIINALALAVVFGGSYTLSAQKTTNPGTGGTCCDATAKTCYLKLDDVIIQQPNGYSC